MKHIAQITDSHCHLDFPDFHDRDDIVTRALDAGVARMVNICTRLRREPQVRAIAEAYRSVYYAVGNHPIHTADEPLASVERLVELALHPKLVGIGESGLDYHYTVESRDIQQASLRIHIEAARRTGLPLIIHSRDADDDMARILKQEHCAEAFSCVMHCFSSGRRLAEAALDLGFYLSISGIAAFPKSAELRAIFRDTPVDRILVETDAPYLAPPPNRGRRNEPAFVVDTARACAGLFGLDYAEFAARTEANFDRLFGKATVAGSATR